MDATRGSRVQVAACDCSRLRASMKLALLWLTSAIVISASGAFAQGKGDACHKQYVACMERCTSRPAKGYDTCSQRCEGTSNQCYIGTYNSPAPRAAATPPYQSPSSPDQSPSALDQAQAAEHPFQSVPDQPQASSQQPSTSASDQAPVAAYSPQAPTYQPQANGYPPQASPYQPQVSPYPPQAQRPEADDTHGAAKPKTKRN
jgi:hypothetical protein